MRYVVVEFFVLLFGDVATGPGPNCRGAVDCRGRGFFFRVAFAVHIIFGRLAADQRDGHGNVVRIGFDDMPDPVRLGKFGFVFFQMDRYGRTAAVLCSFFDGELALAVG